MTEFLPVSSSGHLVLAQEITGYRPEGIILEVTLHVATVIAVLVYYSKRIAGVVKAGADVGGWPRFAGLIITASVPAGVVGLLLKERIENLFENPLAVGFALLFTAAVLTSLVFTRPRGITCATIGWGSAFLIGVGQAVAIVPGISRSGMTIVVAMWLGVIPEESAAFSFVLSVPAVLGAAVLTAKEVTTMDVPLAHLSVSFIAAVVTGILAIHVVIRSLAAGKFYYFALYCCIIGVITIATETLL